MHYRQTIVDTVTAALEGLSMLPGGVTSKRFFPQAQESNPAARCWVFTEIQDADQVIMDSRREPRIMTLRVRVVAAGDDVQRLSNDALEQVEATIPGALSDTVDCVYLTRLETEIAAVQDRETMINDLDYTVWYQTVLGAPNERAN